VSRPLTFSGSFAASAAPSRAIRGRLGALPPLGAGLVERLAPEALREGAVARGVVLLAAVPTGARRRWLARCGRLLGSRLMMSGALVRAGDPAAFARAEAGLDLAAPTWPLDRLLEGVARVAPGGVESRSKVASRGRWFGVRRPRGAE
jgi:hypothetical protein